MIEPTDYTAEQLRDGRYSLNDVEYFYQQRRVSAYETERYIEMWNTGAFRFTRAELRDGRIRQTERD